MRERRAGMSDNLKTVRITPAYAGKTFPIAMVLPFSRDHPRVCGKDLFAFRDRLIFQGSPPRMRERLNSFIRGITRSRITPAYAGKTIAIPLLRCIHRDHPRVCGKDRYRAALRFNITGSPPRMRERLMPLQ